ncbi:L-aspartate oxidase [Nakamurella sp. A5-74]|uniref:L-aspartate oxidase n=1 Tax=Nakamurella sp. A5-74 TaxID=3158264 RepID=A0AAU8DWU9_9ACTN
MWDAHVDVVVVGSGVAGLTAAHDAAAAGLRVVIITKDAPEAGSTRWAQGGIAVVDAATGDTIDAHLHDTVVAGAGLTDPVVAAAVVTEGIAAVARLRARGAVFDSLAPSGPGDPGALLRTREGGHHADRIIHAGGDATGAEVERALLAATGMPAVLAGHLALDVVTDVAGSACGVTVLAPSGRVGLIRAGAVVLATGGCGQLYAATSNPPVATADGVAIALRAGAQVADLEFIQFHPTVLFTDGGLAGQRPLVSEAVRGAGAVLVDGAGRRVMTGVHPLADLAPRDVVSLAITRRMAENPGGIDDHVFLDARAVEGFARRFPTITAACTAAGVDPQRQLIPVAPAEHFQCGGVWTDLQGRTTINRLYAVGEVARTGLHGANRLASNSLLEGLVMGERAAADIVENPVPLGEPIAVPQPRTVDPPAVGQLQRSMSKRVGIGRDATSLAQVLFPRPDPGARVSRESVEAANITLVARLVVTAAATRTESRGAHVRLDFPERRLAWAQPISLTLTADDELEIGALRPAVPV